VVAWRKALSLPRAELLRVEEPLAGAAALAQKGLDANPEGTKPGVPGGGGYARWRWS
jgi:hypothetical protein